MDTDINLMLTKRVTDEEILRQSSMISAIPHLIDVLDAMPHIVWILNDCRQIVYANKVLFDFLEYRDVAHAYGLKPGEAMNCPNASKKPEGCGATDSCVTCGALLATLSGLRGKTDSQECRVFQKNSGEAYDLRIHAAPFQIGEDRFVVVSAMDISHEKRRRTLERIFFHDILNVAGAVQFISDLITHANPEELPELGPMLHDAVIKMVEEINAQKDLAAAENNELKIEHEIINSLEILQDTIDLYTRYRVTAQQNVLLDKNTESIDFSTDRTILRRVIGNMLKNALEATAYEADVTVGSQVKDGRIVFWVHNPGSIPVEAQSQIFQRSFSTKSEGRGLGTYSMKLLTERYLHGEVFFESSPETGTTFFAAYPMS